MTQKVLLVDNYDSFTYNLVQLLEQLGATCEVLKNDEDVYRAAEDADKVVLSPGPGIPSEAGHMMDLIRHLKGRKPLLGVCLGHQGIAEVYGSSLFNLPAVLHGVTSAVSIHGTDPLFVDVPDGFTAAHYHSWAVHPESLSASLRVIATNAAGVIMAIRHEHYPVYGLQFHPESILTPCGKQILKNWLHTN